MAMKTCEDFQRWSTERTSSRRDILRGLAVGSLVWGVARSALSQVVLNPQPTHDRLLVVFFLRGGADGLSLVAPVGDDAYHRARPNLAVPVSSPKLDDRFAFHPELAPLLHRYHNGELAIVHAVGSGDQTRSHFSASSAMERGLATADATLASGWLARYLRSTALTEDPPLRAVALGGILPEAFRGATQVQAIRSLADYALNADDIYAASLARLYTEGEDEMARAGRATLDALASLRRLDPTTYVPEGEAEYPPTPVGEALRQVAMLHKADLGLEVAWIEQGVWDTHVAQGSTGGWLAGLASELAYGLDAFCCDLGRNGMRNTTVVVMTEFGRRLRENEGLGTDHGRASVMFLLGAGVRGGRVVTDWPGLEAEQLEGPGDLRVTTDYRDVLAEVVAKRLRPADLDHVFPGHRPQPRGLLT